MQFHSEHICAKHQESGIDDVIDEGAFFYQVDESRRAAAVIDGQLAHVGAYDFGAIEIDNGSIIA